MTELINLNKFVKGKDGVFSEAAQADREFAYSDGQEVEQRLFNIFNSVKDLSSTSYELKKYITDWPSEYHLTPVRSNLLRVLDLSGVKRVLELGCGCGSISRYLGEQADIEVDAIEGSPARAGLAALRCRDLPNVTVSTANFNDIEFPQDYYDLVLFVGVTEYAGRFSDEETDEQALQALLALAKKTAKKDGVVLVAIENRTGMKYVVGANEDHYAKPYIGIHNYSEPAGIRTYTKNEWQQNINQAGFKQHEFIYPFPDYKIPTIFLGEEYVQSNPYAYVHLEGNRSRDYVQDFKQGSHEVMLWESAVTSGTLGDYANSFLILMANSDESISHLSKYDFAHLPSYDRKLEYCLKIAKPKGKDFVERSYIDPTLTPKPKDGLKHVLVKQEAFYPATSLAVEWSRSLICYPDLQLFEQYLQEYYKFLEASDKLTIDLLPSNILKVAGRYQIIDEEWELKQKLSAEMVFYRAALLFYCSYPDFVEQKLSKTRGLKTIGDWIYFAFQVAGKPINAKTFKDLYKQNESFQKVIAFRHGEIDFDTSLTDTDPLLILQWQENTNNSPKGKQIGEKQFSLKGSESRTVSLDLPYAVRRISNLILRPSFELDKKQDSFFRTYKLEIMAKNAEGVCRTLELVEGQQTFFGAFDLFDQPSEQNTSGKSIAEESVTGQSISGQSITGKGYYILGEPPRMEITGNKELTLKEDEVFFIKLELAYPQNEQHQVVDQRYLSAGESQMPQLGELTAVKNELALLKNSRGWKLLNIIRRTVSLVLKPVRMIIRK